jgi:hypothetical protein
MCNQRLLQVSAPLPELACYLRIEDSELEAGGTPN